MVNRLRSHSTQIVLISACLFTLSWLFIEARPVAATGAGITVTPGRLLFILSKDALEQTLPVHVTNNYNVPVRFSVQLKGIDETAGLLVPTDKVDTNLAAVTAISETDVLVPAHQTHTVQVQIRNLSSLSPGGHYATIVLTALNSKGKNLSLQAAISLSLFAVKVDGAKQNLAIVSSGTNGWLLHAPSSTRITFTNKGNIHVVPRGSISVYGGSERLVGRGIINSQSLPMLPGTVLTVQVPVVRLARIWTPQKLTTVIAYHPDSSETIETVEKSQYYIPPIYLLLLPLLYGLYKVVARRWPRFALKTHRQTQPRARQYDMQPVDTIASHAKTATIVGEQSVATVIPVTIIKPEPRKKLVQATFEPNTTQVLPSVSLPKLKQLKPSKPSSKKRLVASNPKGPKAKTATKAASKSGTTNKQKPARIAKVPNKKSSTNRPEPTQKSKPTKSSKQKASDSV
jgi:hypothetical protein